MCMERDGALPAIAAVSSQEPLNRKDSKALIIKEIKTQT